MSEIGSNEDSTLNENVASQYLSFTLADEIYGVDILRVQEIRGWEDVREIPNTPNYIKGVLNLRDTVVPIIDLRLRFTVNDVEYTPTTVIIVLAVMRNDNKHVVGVVVDSVSDVFDVSIESIKKAPDFGTKVNTQFINGMVMLEQKMVVLLDCDRLLNPDELAALERLTNE